MHYREKSKLSATANNRATQRLKAHHRQEFDELLEEERARLGLPPLNNRELSEEEMHRLAEQAALGGRPARGDGDPGEGVRDSVA